MSVRAAVMDRPNEVAIREFDRPAIGPDAALIQVEMAGICGSDPKLFHGELTWRHFQSCPFTRPWGASWRWASYLPRARMWG